MKKIILSCLLAFSCAAYSTQEIDHSINLTSTYRTTSGTEIVFDLDQCSRLGFLLIMMGEMVENRGARSIGVLIQAIANLKMANIEFERNEIARGLEHLPISFVSLYIFCTKDQTNDRLRLNRISWALPFIKPITEPYLFIKDLNRGHSPISWS